MAIGCSLTSEQLLKLAALWPHTSEGFSYKYKSTPRIPKNYAKSKISFKKGIGI